MGCRAGGGRVCGVSGEPAAGFPVPGAARVPGAKSDRGDAHVLADTVGTDSYQLRSAPGDSPQAEAVKVVAFAHKTLIWDRTRSGAAAAAPLGEYFPATLKAFEDLDAPDVLELLAKAPDPARAAKLTPSQVPRRSSAPRRRSIANKTGAILAALRGEHLGHPPALAAAHAAAVRSLVAVNVGHGVYGRGESTRTSGACLGTSQCACGAQLRCGSEACMSMTAVNNVVSRKSWSSLPSGRAVRSRPVAGCVRIVGASTVGRVRPRRRASVSASPRLPGSQGYPARLC